MSGRPARIRVSKAKVKAARCDALAEYRTELDFRKQKRGQRKCFFRVEKLSFTDGRTELGLESRLRLSLQLPEEPDRQGRAEIVRWAPGIPLAATRRRARGGGMSATARSAALLGLLGLGVGVNVYGAYYVLALNGQAPATFVVGGASAIGDGRDLWAQTAAAAAAEERSAAEKKKKEEGDNGRRWWKPWRGRSRVTSGEDVRS